VIDAPLADAIRTFVEPGDHLHFASTPSRSNVAIRELARQFRHKRPGFLLSTSGFHSTAHLLAALRLGRTYLGCFFGDNWPSPRPNPLYTRLARELVDLEHWSLLTYVEAFRAGALGHGEAPTNSLAGTDLGADLAKRGKFRAEGFVKALRADVTFVHAPFADEQGRVLFSPPYGEGFWSALGARKGVIATVERIVSPGFAAQHPEAIKIPSSKFLAVCVEPFGAHPQPLYVSPAFEGAARKPLGYADDREQYERWRGFATDEKACEAFADEVLGAERMRLAYHSFAGPERLQALRDQGRRSCVKSETPRSRNAERMVRLAAYVIGRRVRTQRHRSILAGIGNAFFAAQLAKAGVPVMVETGLFDVACRGDCDGFLLSHDHIASARRLSSVEDVLGTLACGAGNDCLGVIGAAQVDAAGAVNSTQLADGTVLVGSGGANDIASAAEEVIVVAAGDRLMKRVDYVTSPGQRVVAIVTDRYVLEREPGERWRMTARIAGADAACPWVVDVSSVRTVQESALFEGALQ
jgi:acyl CoA:acetate/3-ketoacid CoA transferase alpha subunit